MRGGHGRVLVVGGNGGLSQSVPDLLTRAGHVVKVVGTADAALRALRMTTFDCLVVDFELPDLRGDVFFEFARMYQPRLLRRTVFLIAEVLDQAMWLSRLARCPTFHPPIDVDQFLATVDQLMAAPV